MFGALDDFLKEDFFHRHQTGTLTLMKPPDSGDSQSSQNGNKDSSGDGQASDREIPFTIFAVLETDANISELFEPLGSERALAYAAAHALYDHTDMDAEAIVREALANGVLQPPPPRKEVSPRIQELERQFRSWLGMKIKLTSNDKGKGKLVIQFNSNDDFERIYQALKPRA